MDELSKEIASLPSDVLSKAYDDALHPVLSSVGDTLSLVPRTVGVLLGPWKKWVVNGESNIEEAIRQIEEKRKTSRRTASVSLHRMLWCRLFSNCHIRTTVRT